MYIFSTYGYRQRHRVKPLPVTEFAIGFLDKLLVIIGAHSVLKPLLHHLNNALEHCLFSVSLSAEISYDVIGHATRSVQKNVVSLLREVTYGHVKCESESLSDRAEKRTVPALLLKRLESVDVYSALGKRELFIGNYSVYSNFSGLSKT